MVNGTGDRGGKRTASTSDDRADRLAEALRANLRRRKTQARARRKGAAVAQEDTGAGPETTTKPGKDS